MAEYDARNRLNLKNATTVRFIQANQVVLIGSGHRVALVNQVKRSSVYQKGLITKQGNTLYAQHRRSDRAQFDTAIRRISKKKIKYVDLP